MKCTDNERNIILAMTQEYRQPTQADAKRALERHGSEGTGQKLSLEMRKRFVGLVVVPGAYIERIEQAIELSSLNEIRQSKPA